MKTAVLDASVAAKWLFKEPHSDLALRLLNGEYYFAAPDFMLVEVANVITRRLGELKEPVEVGLRGLEQFRRVCALTVRFHPAAGLVADAMEIARELGKQRLFDCLYLALAKNLSWPLLTADRKFFDSLQSTRFASDVVWIEAATAP